ncbi:hypothetical protein PHMEG_00033845 [Phytophthora megakarya]|uniref:RNase H type-1 domain-containing protein n=1 Tax=Phytophthora megakarya TaxID=4795 RepID=A0A225USW9_9STRA|nr:hypothetical protein PHMEG_00033845 [Phytophthora megakarya]
MGRRPGTNQVEDLDALLYRLRYWNISVSLPKSEFGKLAIPFLSHEVNADGIRALPKIVKGIENLPFPSTYKGTSDLRIRIPGCGVYALLCAKVVITIQHRRWTTSEVGELELSRWTLEIHRTQKDEDSLAAILGSGITSREHLDKVAETLIPAKGRLNVMQPVGMEMLDASYQGYVLSFDGAAKVVKAEGHILDNVMVNDAEYHGLILGLKLAMRYDVKELVVVGDSLIVVQQAQGLINCNQPNLQRRLAEYDDLRKDFVSVKLIHVKREFNQAADYLTSKSLNPGNFMMLGESWELDGPDEIVHLRLVSRIPEKIMKSIEIPGTPPTDVVRLDQVKLGTGNPDAGIPEAFAAAAEVLMVITRSRAVADKGSRTPVDQSGYQDERWRRIKVHQDEDLWIQQMKKVLTGDVSDLPRNQVNNIAEVSDQFVLYSREIIYRLSTPTPGDDHPGN